MNRKSLILLLAVLNLACLAATAALFGTGFTYQGRLTTGTDPANGNYDFRFSLYDAVTNGNPVAGPLTLPAVVVSNGLFIAALDFGENVFTGADRWLEIGVRTNSSSADFDLLSPRQSVTPAPYAITAGSASSAALATSFTGMLAGDVAGKQGATVVVSVGGETAENLAGGASAANKATSANTPNSLIKRDGSGNFSAGMMSGSFSGNGMNLTNVNAASLGGLNQSSFWQAGGNTGANPTNNIFLGTTDNLPLEIKVNGERALRIEPNGTSPNLISGSSYNVVNNGVVGAVIGGGGGWGLPNRAGGNFSTVPGGWGNTASGPGSTAMGDTTTASGSYSTALGYHTTASGSESTAMGAFTTASGWASTAMGEGNIASGGSSVVMGSRSTASGNLSLAAGYGSLATNQSAFVWSDSSSDTFFGSTADHQFLIRASGGVGIGTNSPHGSLHVASPNGYLSPQVAISQLNTADYARLQIGVNTFTQWTLAVEPSATPVLNFWNGSANAAALTHSGALYAQSFNPTSDRNAKENFQSVDAREVLEKVAALPISEWNFKGDPSAPHLGPMAQDFHAAFGVGADDKHIATVDADGVALAAIKGLNQKLESDSAALRAENRELKARLDKLERLINARNAGDTMKK